MLKQTLFGLGAAFLCVAAAPSFAAATAADVAASNQVQASAAVSSTPQAQATEEKKICKNLPSSGTRFAKRSCLTAKEWQKVEAEAEE